jgi:hypothetical protein
VVRGEFKRKKLFLSLSLLLLLFAEMEKFYFFCDARDAPSFGASEANGQWRKIEESIYVFVL